MKQVLSATGERGVTTLYVSSRAVTAIMVLIVVAAIAEFFAPEFVEAFQTHLLYIMLAAVLLTVLISWFQVRALQAAAASSTLELPKMFVPRPFTLEQLRWYDGAKNSRAARAVREGLGSTTIPSSSSSSSSSKPRKQQKRENQKEKEGEQEDRALEQEEEEEEEEEEEHPIPLYDDLVFVAVKGVVYNVGRDFYGPGAGYSAFAACDASRHLGKVVVGTEESNVDWTNLTDATLETLKSWEDKYREKYSIVGWAAPSEEEKKDYFERVKEFKAER